MKLPQILEKEEIHDHLYNAWKCVFNEECFRLDTHIEEKDPDFTGGNMDGAAGSADAL